MYKFIKRIIAFCMIVTFLASCTTKIQNDGTEASVDSKGFVLMSDVIPDAICEVRYHTTYNFVGQRIDGYEESCIIMTKEAANALKAVSDDVMRQGYRIKVYDAYRPQMAVDHFVRWASDVTDVKMKHIFYPEIDKELLFDQGYISKTSGHSRGSTVDLTLVDEITGKELDMGGAFDYFGEKSHFDYNGNLTEEQKHNRSMLREVMIKHGFKPISTEWWHFVLENEPYPDAYFNFPVSTDSITKTEDK